MVVRNADLYKNKVVVLVVIVAAALIIFSPSTGRIFLSDDYCTLHNVVANNSILLPSFFRPVGDLTLKWTYQFAGLDPFYFYLVNILLHAVNSFLVYIFCITWFGHDTRRHLFSIVAAVVFLTYPSHSEAILWAIGRGVSLATFFSLLAMIAIVGRLKIGIKYPVVCICYFLALACYESALLLPFVLFALNGSSPKRQHFTWSLLLLATLFVHFYLRYVFTGGIWQSYNGIIFSRDIVQYISAFVKIILRLFIPPFNYPLLITICGVVVLACISFIIHRNRKRFETDLLFAKTFVIAITGIVVTVLVSISFGMSTRTSEGDRLMYLPSVFYAILIALLICTVLHSVKSIVIAVVAVIVFQLTFLLINQHNWIRASEYAGRIINGVKENKQRPLYIINMPSDVDGAYVFRNCFHEALMFYNIDTTGVRVVNVIQSTEIEKRKALIVAEKQADDIFVWPNTLLVIKNGSVINVNHDSTVSTAIPLSSFLFWNKQELVPLR